MRKLFFILAVMMAVMIPVWLFAILPQILWRIPPDWDSVAKNIGYMNWPDPVTNQWTKDETSIYDREKKVIKSDKNRGVIEDRYTVYDPLTGKVIWEYIPNYIVDLKTGINLTGKDRQGFNYVFPSHIKKETYTLSTEYYKKVPFGFIGEEKIEGLDTYIFEFKGVTEFTECYAGSDKYPGIIPPEGQEIRSTDSFIIRYWVEPVSGEIVKFEEDCPDGDWIVDKKTGEKIKPVLIWGGKTTGDAVCLLACAAKKRKAEILFKARVVPIGFGILAVIFAIAGLSAKTEKKE